MSGEVEALGGLATAALAAREIDRAQPHAHAHQLSACQNCGARLHGAYCHECGQSGHVHRTLGHVFEEFAHGVLHVDGKLWRTLPMLAFNPGRLTREYVHGKRARYIAPLALYLFVVLLTFVVFGFLGGALSGPTGMPLAEARVKLAEARAELAASRRKSNADPADLRSEETVVRVLSDMIARAEQGGRTELTANEVRSAMIDAGAIQVDLGDVELNGRIHHAISDPDMFLYKVQQKAYKLAFLLVPLSLPFVWVLFAWKRNVTLYDHTVFILYSLSFMCVLVCAAISLSVVKMQGLAGLLVTIVPPVHFYAQLKGAYSLSVMGALWRALTLTVLSIIVLSLYVSLLFGIGLLD